MGVLGQVLGQVWSAARTILALALLIPTVVVLAGLGPGGYLCPPLTPSLSLILTLAVSNIRTFLVVGIVDSSSMNLTFRSTNSSSGVASSIIP